MASAAAWSGNLQDSAAALVLRQIRASSLTADDTGKHWSDLLKAAVFENGKIGNDEKTSDDSKAG